MHLNPRATRGVGVYAGSPRTGLNDAAEWRTHGIMTGTDVTHLPCGAAGPRPAQLDVDEVHRDGRHLPDTQLAEPAAGPLILLSKFGASCRCRSIAPSARGSYERDSSCRPRREFYATEAAGLVGSPFSEGLN